MTRSISRALGAIIPALALFVPGTAHACACGCGVFDVGDNTLIPMTADHGVSVFYRFAAMAQSRNHAGNGPTDAADNPDKRIATQFHTFGAEVRVARNWTVMAELPLVARNFTSTVSDGQGNDIVASAPLTALGDIVLRATWSGLAADGSTGLTSGVKLPTGRTDSPADRFGNRPFDRDTMPGTGSTDLIFGGYHVGAIGTRGLRWFAQAQYQVAVARKGDYRPGNDLNGALGVSYRLPGNGTVAVSPVLQLIGSVRARDSGSDSDPLNSGYRRLLIAPGVRVHVARRITLYGDVELPIAQHVNAASPAQLASGEADSRGQLVAPVMFRAQIGYAF